MSSAWSVRASSTRRPCWPATICIMFPAAARIDVVVATPEFQPLATNDVGDDSTFNASLAVAGNRLLVRLDR